ncbi:MAG TPA: aspartate kinase [Steroidobacteraceae bacterium]|nr:aspartate kinase [Steroidobacteraceae bacterium]
MALIVQKYGGTSVGSLELIRRVAERVHERCLEGTQVVVVVSAMGDSTDRLVDLARGICDEPDAREMDVLLATGEQVSIALLCMALRARGCAARSYTGSQVRMLTSNVHGRARIEDVETERLRADLNAGFVPVVAGFQGVDAAGDITTIGRGGSDTTAVALAVALRADECQILTDVDGVYTTDPRMVPQARRLERVTFDEMLELAGQGSRVLHLRSVEFASKYNVPLRVASSFAPGPGTLICREEPRVEAPVVSGIAFNRDEAEITVAGVPDVPGTAHRLLRPVSDASIEVDMIVLNAPRDGKVDLTFTVHRDDYAAALKLVGGAAAALGAANVSGHNNVAKLSVVGVGMRSHAGVATMLFETLAHEKINVRLVSTSEIKISVLVDESALERGVRSLHAAFGLERQKAS